MVVTLTPSFRSTVWVASVSMLYGWVLLVLNAAASAGGV